jgi:nucleotide-binding universal stress UspA family protein
MPLNLLSKEALLKGLSTILVPTDLSEHSRRALLYGCWLAADDKASLLVLHVANELNAWEYQTDELALVELRGKTWPVDRVLSEGNLDLVRFLEPSWGPTYNSRALIDACKPFEWMDEFPEVAESSPAYIEAVRKKWRQLF